MSHPVAPGAEPPSGGSHRTSRHPLGRLAGSFRSAQPIGSARWGSVVLAPRTGVRCCSQDVAPNSM